MISHGWNGHAISQGRKVSEWKSSSLIIYLAQCNSCSLVGKWWLWHCPKMHRGSLWTAYTTSNNQTCTNPHPWFPGVFCKYFASESTKINHMRSNHRHKIRFQDIVYLKFNKWIEILKNVNKKNSTWCTKLVRKQEIILFLYRTTKCPTEAKKIDFAKMS